MFAQTNGLQALEDDLSSLSARLVQRLHVKANTLAQTLAAKVRDEKLSGQTLNSKSGALKRSIAADVVIQGGEIIATVGSHGDIKYAAIQEYGGRTSAHEILPDKAQALAFLSNGALRFARRIEHPGSAIPAHAYLASAFDESITEIEAAMADAFDEVWSER